MSVIKFLDTNILVYAFDLDAPAKREVAMALIEAGWNALGETAISVQVLQELHVSLVKRGMARNDASQIVRDFFAWPVVDNSLELFQAGLVEQTRWQISLWDALILAAARASGAAELITEDLNEGQDYDGVIVRNPFR